jgi:uncharacterized protein YjgD (DUF1641 family)
MSRDTLDNNLLAYLRKKKSFFSKMIIDSAKDAHLLAQNLLNTLHNHLNLTSEDKDVILKSLNLFDIEDLELIYKELLNIASQQSPQDQNFIQQIVAHALSDKNNDILNILMQDQQFHGMIMEALRSDLIVQNEFVSHLYGEYRNLFNIVEPEVDSDIVGTSKFFESLDGNNNNASEVGKVTSEMSKATSHSNEATASMLSLIGIFMVGYEVSANNALLRNSYSEYLNKIQSISDQELLDICKQYPNVDEQNKQVKIFVRNKFATEMYNKTVYAGATGTLLFSAAMAIFIGPFSIIPALFGAGVTLAAASHNKNLLLEKLDKALEHDLALDGVIAKKIQDLQNKDATIKPEDVKEKRISNFMRGNLISIMTLRFFGLGSVLSNATPIIAGILAVIRTVVSWHEASKGLNMMYQDPVNALRAGLRVEIEATSLTSNYYARNELKKYLLKNLSEVENLMNIQGITTQRQPGKLEQITRKIMSTLGIWEDEHFNGILETLYLPDNKNHLVLDNLRHKCMQESFDTKLDRYFEKNRQNLEITVETLDELRASGNVNEYNKLLRSYLNDTAANNAAKIVKFTGFNTVITAAIVTMTIGMMFSPAAPVALATVGLIAAGYIGTKIAENYYRRKMKNIVSKVNDQEISEIFAAKLYEKNDKSLTSNIVNKNVAEKSVQDTNKTTYLFRPFEQPTNNLPAKITSEFKNKINPK